ncbi:hypothetical protein NDU88_001668 [Pleurodeles waltl]|uniref:Uncharacterized protein n=1 Tax=Pleurodeles waltl TaxID=8319 RepID=A0AAV7NE19_PLEWA|nr:hypothetical protein NDU88_001668 [Pleurodeles waltl]
MTLLHVVWDGTLIRHCITGPAGPEFGVGEDCPEVCCALVWPTPCLPGRMCGRRFTLHHRQGMATLRSRAQSEHTAEDCLKLSWGIAAEEDEMACVPVCTG